ncbi:hypothetical protein [Heyndrickxia coagulans]|uniref:Uncharacterized protein n=2 Tax=Heyndrickxia coagulans TaxID=1398 RepID=A0A8B4BY39_HEYCO|nr:hypothetical protein [Heyndrickxia coagulans]AJH78652.1 hypothetical protein BF29_2802 [Heyndrickxia coagulans DSM 1 = ATCC 7050]MCR2847638.1 hypothetical protein [Heyndrickxia coagulans]MDR4225387.1 hypothetical protein [Heyndrickxia coagulans DSM 1 = ATCC 7050]MED4493556.1 hypothetical protein [Heyndrickxia coagulans]MED4537580.1 hypothetical protein [Heyndrickxia coagulans]
MKKVFILAVIVLALFFSGFIGNKPAIAESPDSTDEITINATSDLNDQGNSTSSVSTVSETNPLFIPTDPELNTKYGSGGISKITYVGGGQLYWYVKPATKWPYYFDGTIKVVYDSGHTPRIYEISGVGALGSSVSDTIPISKTKGATAYLTGTAYALKGDQYLVVPGCKTHYKYGY